MSDLKRYLRLIAFGSPFRHPPQQKIQNKKKVKVLQESTRKFVDICQKCNLSIEDNLLEQKPDTEMCIACTNELIVPERLCIDCAQKINPKLLQLKPKSYRCILCQGKLEKGSG